MKHSGPISCVASHDKYVATSAYDNRVILWDAITHKALAKGMHDHLVNHCSFSSDGRWLVSAGSDYSARIWELPYLRLRAVLSNHDDDVDMAVFSPDNQHVATCALDRAVRIFDLHGRCLHTFLGHTGNIISLLWNLDGKQLVSSSVDGTVRAWDVELGVQASCYDLEGVRTDTIVMDGQGRIIAGDDLGRLAVISQGQITYHDAHQAGIKKLVYCDQRQLLVSLSYDRTMAFWAMSPTGTVVELRRTSLPAVIWSRAAAFLNGSQLALGTFGGTYAVYDWQQDRWQIDERVVGQGINAVVCHQGYVYTVGDAGIVCKNEQAIAKLGSLCNFLLPAEQRLFTGGQLGQLFDALSGEVLYQHHSPLNCGALFYSAGLAHIAVGTYTGEMLVFSLNSDTSLELVRELPIYKNAIKSIAANHEQLFSVCASSDIAWHNCQDLSLVNSISKAHDKIANACCQIADVGFASVSRDRALRLWLDGEQAVYETPHTNSVKCIAVSADGGTLLTGSYGGTLAGFDVATRRWTSFNRPTIAGISSITYDESGHCFLAASYDGGLYTIAH